MGGKGGGSAPPPPSSADSGTDMLMALLSNMPQPTVPAPPAPPQQIPVPMPTRTPEVDWTDKHKQLASKMKADYSLDRARKISLTDTIVTSPLLDEEDPMTTGSLLAPPTTPYDPRVA